MMERAAAWLLVLAIAMAGCIQGETASVDGAVHGPDPSEASAGAQTSDGDQAARDGGREGTAKAESDREDPAERDRADDANTTNTTTATGGSDAPPSNVTAPQVFDPVRDILLDETYLVAPVHEDSLGNHVFEVEPGYEVLEIVGRLETPVHYYADNVAITVYDPSGAAVIRFSGITTSAAHIGDSMSNTNFPIGYHYRPAPGTYSLEISGVSAKQVHIWAYGNAGMAPDFEYRDVMTGEIGHLRDHVGKIVLIDLMATWCGPCHASMPRIQALAEDFSDTVQILSIDVDESESDDDLRGMKEEYGADWIWAFEIDNSASAEWGTGWIPSFGLVDQNGGLLYRQIGAFDDDKVRELIEWALEQT